MRPLESIVNPLPAVLAAWNALLEKAGHKVWTVAAFDEPPPNAKKLSPYLETQITNLQASGQDYPLAGRSYWSSWSATIITRASTMRGKNGDKHNALVGAIYVLAATNRTLNAPPAHYIQHFRPSGLVSSTDGLLDHSDIHLDIHIFVRDDAWPQT